MSWALAASALMTLPMASMLASWNSRFLAENASCAFWASATAWLSSFTLSATTWSAVALVMVKFSTVPCSVGLKPTVAMLPNVTLSRTRDARK